MNVQPLDRNNITYFLFFEKENLTIEIEKPIGLEKAEIEIKQNSGGFGRYITFADGVELTFSPRLDHQFSKLCQNYKIHKWQNGIYFLIKINDVLFYKGRMKLDSAETDYNYFFKTRIDVNGVREIIEAKKSETINLLSNKSIDNSDISEISLQDILTKYKEILVDNLITSTVQSLPTTFNAPSNNYSYIFLNLFNKAGNIDNKITIIEELIHNQYNFSYWENVFSFVKNGPVINKYKIKITDIDVSTNINGGVRIGLLRFKGFPNSNGYFDVASWNPILLENNNNLNIANFEEDIILQPNEVLGYGIFLYNTTPNLQLNGTITINKKPFIHYFDLAIYENSITKCARLIDIGKQTLKSITNDSVSVIAPRFTESGGNFFDIFATSGLFLRQFLDQPFYASWDGFLKYIKSSFNCDAQIKENEVFIGHETDFYQDIEVGRFSFNPNDNSFKVKPNSRIVKSSFSIGYDKYEDDKNSSNTIDSIHVKSEWYLSNSQPLESAKDENTISFVADQYKLENIRRESFSKDSTKTIPNDKDIYVIDTITKDGILQNRSNEGFDTENIFSPETTYNLRLSVKRLLIDYYSEFLSNVSRFTNDVISWKNTSYLNNGKAKTKPKLPLSVLTKNIELIESENIAPEQLPQPTLTGDIYEFDLSNRVKFDEALELMNRVVNEKGYITFFDENNSETEIKIFISELKYSWENEKLYNIKGEQKYE